MILSPIRIPLSSDTCRADFGPGAAPFSDYHSVSAALLGLVERCASTLHRSRLIVVQVSVGLFTELSRIGLGDQCENARRTRGQLRKRFLISVSGTQQASRLPYHW